MDDRICKNCKYFLEASDGIIHYEICLQTENKESTTCPYLQLASLGKAIAKAFNKAFCGR